MRVLVPRRRKKACAYQRTEEFESRSILRGLLRRVYFRVVVSFRSIALRNSAARHGGEKNSEQRCPAVRKSHSGSHLKNPLWGRNQTLL
jgi:hypothetical protein